MLSLFYPKNSKHNEIFIHENISMKLLDIVFLVLLLKTWKICVKNFFAGMLFNIIPNVMFWSVWPIYKIHTNNPILNISNYFINLFFIL